MVVAKGIITMSSARLVGFVRIGLVAASIAIAGEAVLGSTRAAAELEVKTPTVLVPRSTSGPVRPLLATRCDTFGRLEAGALDAGDPKQAHDFKQ